MPHKIAKIYWIHVRCPSDMRRIIVAYNVCQGGGLILLNALRRASAGRPDFFWYLDDRNPETTHANENVTRVHPTLFSRFRAEWLLRKRTRSDDSILCFGNLPPLFPSKGVVSIFIQNRLLLADSAWSLLTKQHSLRLFVEKLWLTWTHRGRYRYFVQTQSMASLLMATLPGTSPQTVPFAPSAILGQAKPRAANGRPLNESRFIYVASGDPHKNHLNLIAAWRQLASLNHFPELTLLSWSPLPDPIKDEVFAANSQFKTRVRLVTGLREEATLKEYQRHDALIFPSFSESLGLPLLEASHLGLPILASELDYVRDICNPEQTFDPSSSLSIARAVIRFAEPSTSQTATFSAEHFLDSWLKVSK